MRLILNGDTCDVCEDENAQQVQMVISEDCLWLHVCVDCRAVESGVAFPYMLEPGGLVT